MKNFTYKGKSIGTLKGNNFYKSVDKNKHFMKMYNAWGIDKNVLYQLKNSVNIIYTDKNIKTVWAIPSKIWKEKGMEKDWNCGVQVFLEEKYFWKKDESQSTLF